MDHLDLFFNIPDFLPSFKLYSTLCIKLRQKLLQKILEISFCKSKKVSCSDSFKNQSARSKKTQPVYRVNTAIIYIYQKKKKKINYISINQSIKSVRPPFPV